MSAPYGSMSAWQHTHDHPGEQAAHGPDPAAGDPRHAALRRRGLRRRRRRRGGRARRSSSARCVITTVAPMSTRLGYSSHPTAEAELRRVAEKVAADFPVRALAAVHRVGDLAVGDLAVVVAVSCPHRARRSSLPQAHRRPQARGPDLEAPDLLRRHRGVGGRLSASPRGVPEPGAPASARPENPAAGVYGPPTADPIAVSESAERWVDSGCVTGPWRERWPERLICSSAGLPADRWHARTRGREVSMAALAWLLIPLRRRRSPRVCGEAGPPRRPHAGDVAGSPATSVSVRPWSDRSGRAVSTPTSRRPRSAGPTRRRRRPRTDRPGRRD